MNELLNNPAVQAGVAPFVVALIVAVLLHRSRLLGLAIGAGFFTVVFLALGFSFDSLTSVRKMILAGLAQPAGSAAGTGQGAGDHCGARRACPAAAAVAVWVIVRVLQQREMGAALFAGAAAALYLASLVESANRISNDPVRAASAALMLGLASGGLDSLLGASRQWHRPASRLVPALVLSC